MHDLLRRTLHGQTPGLRTAGAYPKQVAAVAGFRGGGLPTDEPDNSHAVSRTGAVRLPAGNCE
jgi:carboxymethylenebutenolidase